MKGEKLVGSLEAELGYLSDDERGRLAGLADGWSGFHGEEALRTLIAKAWLIGKAAG